MGQADKFETSMPACPFLVIIDLEVEPEVAAVGELVPSEFDLHDDHLGHEEACAQLRLALSVS